VSRVEISNPVPVDEVEGWVRQVGIGLLANPYDSEFSRRFEARRRNWVPERVWGVKEEGRWVATLRTDVRSITVPGPHGSTVDLVADALTGVTVAATHRRQGILTRMLTESLAAARDRGDALSILIAAEWPIYGRFGYAPAVWASNYTYRPRDRGASVSPADAGRIRQVEPAEMSQKAPAIFDAYRTRRAGQVDRDQDWWSQRLGQDGFTPSSSARSHWFLHEAADGTADGLLSWKVTRDFELDGRLGAIAVDDFYAANPQAYQDMCAYLSGIDVVEEITFAEFAVDEELRWLLTDGRALRQSYTGDWTWIRLLDTSAALTGRGYSTSERLVLEVVDDGVGAYAAGRYLLDASPEGTQCTPTTRSADLRLSQQALASAYLGGQSFRGRAIAGGVEELRTGALSRADALFRTALAPANATGF
jgi:predicted acetyltransferase